MGELIRDIFLALLVLVGMIDLFAMVCGADSLQYHVVMTGIEIPLLIIVLIAHIVHKRTKSNSKYNRYEKKN